jgi:ArsR family transcriptional regulator, arsenate/arsenite/antimonite-responsive transcriptional repressor
MENQATQITAISEIASLLKILSEPNRLRILEKIMDGVQCNCELGSALQMAPNLISHHLSVLRDEGLIDTERDPMDARWVYYSVNLKKLEELRMVFDGFFDPSRVKPRLLTCGPSFLHEKAKNCA